MHPEKPFSINPCYVLELVPGHGLESRLYGGASSEYLQSIPDDIVAPDEYYPHPYKDEIDSLKYRSYQLKVEAGETGKHGTSGTLNNPEMSSMQGVWIDTEKDLIVLIDRINSGGDDTREIAIDLEAHSFRSFSGFVCLMQLSLRRPRVENGQMANISNEGGSIHTAYDFLVDTLALRGVMNKYFAPIMANPDIVKVMHGADSDVGWFQRDFGIYIVNLFDTGRASRALPHFSKAGLAYLLSKYANVEADKKHQLSDWRQRPLPADMLSYATSDTAYLLDIYDKIRLELLKREKGDDVIGIKYVLDASKKVCLIRYDKEAFKPNSYTNLLRSKRGNKAHTDLSDSQNSLLKKLFDWRDATAREEDESLQYVCGNNGLLRIATNCPQSILALKSCVNPLPPLVLKYAQDILKIVRNATGNGSETNIDIEYSPDTIRNTPNEKQRVDRSGIISPVLGTLDLYKRAGWTTPMPVLNNSDEDQTSSSDYQMSEITTQASNRDFSSSTLTIHNLEMKVSGASPSGMSKGVDGVGAAQEAFGEGDGVSNTDHSIVHKQIINAEKAAGRIRDSMKGGNQNLLRLVKTTTFVNEGDEASREDTTGHKEDDEEDNVVEEFQIPKSVSEIYNMSNRNRRKSKKTPVHFSDDEDASADDMDVSQAEEIISKSGPDRKDYFDDSSFKRQRTKSTDTSSVDKDRSDDIELMVGLGWVKDKKEAEGIIVEQKQLLESSENGGGKEKNRATVDADSNNGGKQNPRTRRGRRNASSNIPYDYSKVGPIGVGGGVPNDNPFFAGAAVSGGSLNKSSTGKERKKQNNSRKGGKRQNFSGGNKTHVYRK